MPARPALILLSAAAMPVAADINYGGYVFGDDAFADRAQRNGAGSFFFNDATTVSEALVGFTPDSGLYNIGLGKNANDFTMFFDDVAAADGAGADIVLFDLRWSPDSYSIAVISGGVESAFLEYSYLDAIATGELQDDGVAEAFAFEIDLSDYGVATAEGIRFRSVFGDAQSGFAEGDPTMAGVLNPVPTPGALALLGTCGLLAGRRRR